MAQQETEKVALLCPVWCTCGHGHMNMWPWQHLHAAHVTPSALLLLHDSVKTSAYVEEYSTVFRCNCVH